MKVDDFIPTQLDIDDLRADDVLAEIARNLEILLDGVVQDKVLRYDAKAGTLTRYVQDSEGHIVIVGWGNSRRAATEECSGRVEVRLKETKQ